MNNFFPKNYGASGIGLVNLAAFGYSESERQRQQPPKQGLYPALPKLDDFIYAKSASQHHSSGPTAPSSGFQAGFQMPTAPPSAPYPTGPSGGLPYPTSSMPYPMGGMGGAPSLPYPSAAGMGMPMPYAESQPSSGYSSMYPSIPSLPGELDLFFLF